MMSIARAFVAAACVAVAAVPVHAQQAAGAAARDDGPPLAVRIEWGGGKPRAWAGEITVTSTRSAATVDPEWRLLSRDADAAASVHAEATTLHVHDPRPRGSNGVEVGIDAWADARIVIRLRDAGESRGEVEVAVKELFAGPVSRSLDADGNRLSVAIAEGGGLRVDFGAEARFPATPLYRPGDTVRLAVHPLLVGRPGVTASRELVMHVRDAVTGAELPPQTRQLRAAASVPLADGSEVQACEQVAFEVVLPDRDTAWSISLGAIERGSLRWSRPLVSRTLGIAAVAAQLPDAPAAEWGVVHEFDPGSPRLHERLRRLPGMPAIAVPTVPALRLPQLPLPSMTRPPVSLPKLPNVPLPSVSSIVPRISGLLASGHSSIEPHSLGPMLVLPPSRSLDEPSWEGIVIAGVTPGMPHLVEIEFPRDQDAVFGVNVLEADDRGAVVQCRHAGGFEVTRPVAAAGEAVGLGRHSFVMWPSTKNPLVLIANASLRKSASFGKVRVFAGPARVPAMRVAGGVGPATSSRGVHAFIPTPDGLAFGAGGSTGASSPRLSDEWLQLLRGVRRSADWLSAQNAAGALVSVYSQGGAVWPSSLTLDAPRWFAGSGAGGKDVLGMLCRVYAGAGLKLVAGMTFDGPLPALEAALGIAAETDAGKVGLTLVGRDGRPRRLANDSGSFHYNILDPRVQDAVAELVGDLVGRVDGEKAIDGVALLLPHDGWLHLPGVAWGLDDVTFARFATAAGVAAAPSGADRHARRAALVEGALREAWLAWRSRELAAFYDRLAGVVATGHPQRALYVAPTTLFADGDLAGLFRPQLTGPDLDADVWRDVGIDPAQITASGRVVLLTPHVHVAADGLVDRCTVDNANRSLGVAQGAAAAVRRGVIAVELPAALGVRDVVPHGPFGAAVAEGPVAVHAVRSGAAQSRPLAESLVAGDAEVIFDMGLLYSQPALETVMARRAFGSLPAGPLDLVDRLPAPLVVRTRKTGAGAVAVVVNASEVPARAWLNLAGEPQVVADAVDGARLTMTGGRSAEFMLEPWGVRALAIDGDVSVTGASVAFDAGVRSWVAEKLADLARRRAAVEQPVPCDVLDNPNFDLPQSDGAISGWELVEPRRGSLSIVADDRTAGGRAAAFSSAHGLSTARSNPFPPPATGRISVAMWLRIAAGDQQPPLRIAIEGLQNDREYYRFAPVGGLAGGKPLGPAWSQFVLQIDDLPSHGLESLRVRLDLLGPGAVQVDDVRVFDLAFAEPQRVQLTRMLTMVEQRLAADDVGSCVLALDSYWPRFLGLHVPVGGAEGVGAAADQPGGQPMARPPSKWTWR